ncbi:MAG: aldehyde dehydrogenase EutE [Spirochaetia bacterium]|jgi:propionaldehyde dehydrogenase|nr:aldehyde dehydrogenase EutE [Spirochaetia bacterium]
MANLTDEIQSIVEEVMRNPEIAALLKTQDSVHKSSIVASASSQSDNSPSQNPARAGIFPDLDSAVAAAKIAQRELIALPLDTRRAIIDAMRRVVVWNNADLSAQAVAETGIGNAEDKQVKNKLAAMKTPGVEDLEPRVSTDEHGLTLTELAPWGVIGAITPVTNPIATIASNSIGMIAAGNSVVFNVHPNAKNISCRLISMLNEAIHMEGGPFNLLCAVSEPTIESANALMKHPDISILVVTGGPGVVKAAMGSGKKAICAGPGNPPCVVDATADIIKAGRDIVLGASFDHNVVCICEKEVLAVAQIADRLKEEMRKNGAFELTGAQIDAVTKLVIAEPGGPDREGSPNKAYVGKSPSAIAAAAGFTVPAGTRLLLMEVGREHPLVWTEQLMPVLPLVRMPSVDEAIDFAVIVERGCRHSAMIHSHDIEKLSRMAKAMNCSLFVKNGPCYAGLAQSGAGYTSFTIASPTGEGITRPRTFTRERRCTLVDAFRIV